MRPWVEWVIALTGLAVVGLLAMALVLWRHERLLRAWYALMFEERARELQAHALELERVEQRIKEVESRLAQRGRLEE